jgi:hypothetical protein
MLFIIFPFEVFWRLLQSSHRVSVNSTSQFSKPSGAFHMQAAPQNPTNGSALTARRR